MKALFGSIVVDGRGKIGGHVASKNRSGSYFRTKVTPVNRQSSYQTNVRARLTGISQQWRGLTADQREAWNGAVANYKKKNIFGNLHIPSGFNLFQKLNNNVIALGGALLTNPPTPLEVDAFANLAPTITATGTIMVMALDVVGTGNSGYKLFATPPVSAGVSFAKSEFRLIDQKSTSPDNPLNFEAEYVAKFGSFPLAGTKVFIKIVPVDSFTGIEGLAVSTSTIVNA